MKWNKIFTTVTTLLITSLTSFGQITINASDVPMISTATVYDLGPMSPPTQGSNQNWDYATQTPAGTLPVSYITETDNFWTNMGVDVYRMRNKYMNSNPFFFTTQGKIDHAPTGILQKGIHVPYQIYDISTITGNAGDSLSFPMQNIVYSTPITYMPFPLTANYNNSQSTRVSVDFIINAPNIGLNNTPCKQVYYIENRDSAIGWGTMRVYTPSGPSGYHDVLMQKRQLYYTDSFYVNGAPISPALAAAFSVSQGQRTQEANAIEFQRRGSSLYLMRMYAGTDSTCTNITEVFSDSDNLTPVAVNDVNKSNFTSILYPNPAQNIDIQLMIMGEHQAITSFSILDISGRLITSQKANWQGNKVVLPTSKLSPGMYVLNMSDKENQSVLTETFQIK